MRICFVNTHDIIGGAERCSFDLMTGLRAQGHDVSLIVGRKLSDDPDVHAVKYTFWDWRSRAFLSHRFGVTETTLLTPFQIVFDHHAFRTAEVVNIHNMHGQYWNFWTLPLMGRYAPVVLTLHDEWFLTGDCVYSYDCERWQGWCGHCPQMSWRIRPNLGGRDATRFNLLLKRTAARLCDPQRLVIVTPSAWLSGKVRKAPHLGRFKVETISYGIDTKLFRPQEQACSKARFGLPQDKFCFLFLAVNVWDPRKGIELLMATIRRFGLPTGSVLHLVGNGAAEISARLNRLAVYASEYITDKTEIAQCLSAADCLLLLSSADNLPYTGIEAGACGCPVLARKVGGVPEIISEGVNGFLLGASPSEEQLFERMTEIARIPEADRSRLGAQARDLTTRRFSRERFLTAYQKLFTELAQDGFHSRRD